MQGLMMDYQLTLDRLLEHAYRTFPAKRILTRNPDGQMHTYTYADLCLRSRRLASALVGLGVRPGDRVGTFAWNNHEHLEMYFGIPGAGAVCHTLNIRLFADQLAYIVNHAEDRVIIVDGSLLPLFEKVVPDIRGVEHYVLFNVPRGTETSLPNATHYEDLLAAGDETFEWLSTDERMAMGLCYTSGTTGEPKGALYSHRSMFLHTLGENQAMALGLSETDVVLPVVPQFHAMSWGLPYACTAAGAEMLMPGPFLKPDALAEMIEQHRVTVAAGVPSIWNGLYQELRSRPRDLSALRMLVAGGSAMPRSLIESFEKDLGVNVLQAWGMTETSPLGTVSRLLGQHAELPDAAKWDVKARQGYPIAGVEIRIVDDSGSPLPWDGSTMGELQVRGPWVVSSYFKRERTPEHFTRDGWFRTGDVATIGRDGIMGITDRTKDLVKSGGEWISTVELETALMAHDQVVEAAVIAIPDDQWGERPLAAVVTTPGTKIDPEELRGFLASRFAKFWLPDRFAFVSELPKTSVGKFDKKGLRQRYADGTL